MEVWGVLFIAVWALHNKLKQKIEAAWFEAPKPLYIWAKQFKQISTIIEHHP